MSNKSRRFNLSQAQHKRLHAKYRAESKKLDHNSRAWLKPHRLSCYHGDVMTQQRIRGKVIGKDERKRIFASWMEFVQD